MSDVELHKAILDGEFLPERILYNEFRTLYEIDMGTSTLRTSLKGVRRYLELLSNFVEEEIKTINNEYFD